MTDTLTLEGALVQRICARLAYEPGPGEKIDPARSFFSVDGFRIGEFELNSMDLVEMIVTLEEDFEIPILESNDLREIDTIEKLSTFIASNASASRVEGFCKTWS
ncbi:MAG: acyl carrier protein [Gaiellaceae bacterium]